MLGHVERELAAAAGGGGGGARGRKAGVGVGGGGQSESAARQLQELVRLLRRLVTVADDEKRSGGCGSASGLAPHATDCVSEHMNEGCVASAAAALSPHGLRHSADRPLPCQ